MAEGLLRAEVRKQGLSCSLAVDLGKALNSASGSPSIKGGGLLRVQGDPPNTVLCEVALPTSGLSLPS